MTQPPEDQSQPGGFAQPGSYSQQGDAPPPPQYGQPGGNPPQYGQPGDNPPQYGGQPAGGYGQPTGYGDTTQGYGAPGQGYPQPGQGYGGPAYKGQELGLPPQGPNSLASQWMRLLARIIDFVIVAVIPGAILTPILLDGESFQPGRTEFTGELITFSLILLVIGAIYEIGMLVTRGATLGKMATSMRVARIADGQKPQVADAGIRWAVPAVAGLVPRVGWLIQLVDAAWCLWDGNRQCLHDKAAKTVVVRTK